MLLFALLHTFSSLLINLWVMNEKMIVQFVGFITDLDFNKFSEKWEYYIQQMKGDTAKTTLQKQYNKKSTYKYVSQHPESQQDFRFSFMNKRNSAHFPEHNVKVTHMGGYLPVQIEGSKADRKTDLNIMLFFKRPHADVQLLRQDGFFHKINIYEAYFENCTYDSIIECFVKNSTADDFMFQLQEHIHSANADDSGIYEE